MKLRIQDPCHENWDNMTQLQQGRFCHSCSKEVMDFTQSSDTEIISTLQQTANRVCGRFHLSQINRRLQPQPLSTRLLRRFCLAILLVFGSGLFSIDVTAQKQLTALKNSVAAANTITIQKAGETTIAGQVIDRETKEVISFPEVSVFVSDKFIATTNGDVNGNFELKLENCYEDQLQVRFSASGYTAHTQYYFIKELKQPILIKLNYDMELIEMGMILMGDVEYIPEEPDQE